MTTTTFEKPTPVDDITLAFPASVSALMPPMEDIPEEFMRMHGKWNELTTCWFFRGVKDLELKPKEGIDQDVALRHIRAILGSYEPKHAHKEAAVAYLLSLWFDDAKWEPAT